MSKKPLNLTIHTKVMKLAGDVMKLRGHTSISAFVEELIRDEYERRNGRLMFELPSSDVKVRAVGMRAGRVGAETIGQHKPTAHSTEKTIPPAEASQEEKA